MAIENITVREARARFSELLGQVAEEGAVFSISRWGVEPRALLVSADRYTALERDSAALRSMGKQLHESLQAILELAEKLQQTSHLQDVELAGLRDVAERLADQARQADAIQARSARQEIARLAGRVENQSRVIREGLEDIRLRARQIQGLLNH